MTDTTDAAPITVLIADDDALTAELLTIIFEADPDIVPLTPVSNGSDAVESYARLSPDVTLMDISMPGMNGIEATRAIIRMDPQAKIVLLSTISPGPGIARGLEAGALASLVKTSSKAVLCDTVKQIARDAEVNPSLLRQLAEDIVISGDRLPGAPDVLPQLTDTELSVLKAICAGKRYENIAEDSHTSLHTVKSHTRNLRRKLGADNTAQLIVRALQYRYVSV